MGSMMIVCRKLLVALGALLAVGGGTAVGEPLSRFELKGLPEHVHPLGPGAERRWLTRLLVTLATPTATDLSVHLAAELPAVLGTPYVLIPQGSSSAEVEVTSEDSGKAVAYAWLDDGDGTQLAVQFHVPPSKLRVLADPAQ